METIDAVVNNCAQSPTDDRCNGCLGSDEYIGTYKKLAKPLLNWLNKKVSQFVYKIEHI